MSFMFGKDKTETKIPAWMERGGEDAFRQAQAIAQMGYVPYMGPEVAAYNPNERAAANMANAGAAAFGFDVPQGDPMAGMPMHSSGLGYSSFPIYQQAMEQLRTERPGQYDYLMSFMIDPVTGQPGSRAFAQPVTQPGMDPMAGMFTEGPDSRNPLHTNPRDQGDFSGLLGIGDSIRGAADGISGGLLGGWGRVDNDDKRVSIGERLRDTVDGGGRGKSRRKK